MTEDIIDKLKFPNLWQTPSILKLVDQPTIKPKGIVEDIVISINYLESLVDFMVV